MGKSAIVILALALAGCGELGTDLGYGMLYTVRCNGETFTDMNLIHGQNSFDPRDGYTSIRLNGKHYRDFPGAPCDYWPQGE
jgi:hypothetical protein